MTDQDTAGSPRIVVFGAGSIGCYLGGRLMDAGARVTLIGRPGFQDVIGRKGLRLSDYRDYEQCFPPNHCDYRTDASAATGADLVLLTVKSAGTADAGRQLAPHLAPDTPVVCFQNGVSNAARLQASLDGQRALAGMVPFNVVQESPGHFHQGTEGDLMAERHPALEPFTALFERAGLPLELRDDMEQVLWSKLILNLNNPINALSDRPLKEQLSQRDYRRALALAQRETLALLRRAGIRTIRLASLPTAWIPWVLHLPDALFERVAAQMLAIDPLARSSMWEDIQRGRPTEIEYINGEVVRLAERLGLRAPVNSRLVELVHRRERGETGPWSGAELYRLLLAEQQNGETS